MRALLAAQLTLLFCLVPGESQAACTAGQCHATIAPQAKAHPVIAKCRSCHRPSRMVSATRRRCPSKQVAGKTCLGCHKKTAQQLRRAKHVHGPVAVNACSYCHLSHGGHGKLRLSARGDALCFRCHDAKRMKQVAKHASGKRRCLSCHEAHAGSNAYLVR